MRYIVFVALLLALGSLLMPASVQAEGGTDPTTAALLAMSGDQGLIGAGASRWYRYAVDGTQVEQVEFTLHFWPSDEARYQQVRLELYTMGEAGFTPLGQGFALSRQEEGLPVGRRVWMGWLVPGTYYLRVCNDSPQTLNYMMNLGLGAVPAAVAAGRPSGEPTLADTDPSAALAMPAVTRPSLLASGVLGLRGLRPPGPMGNVANSIDAILEAKNNLYPADAPMMYEVQHGRVRYGQVRWYKIEIGDKQERLDIALHFWPSNGNIYHHVFCGVFTDYRLQVWQHDGPFQAIGVTGDTGRLEDRSLIMNKKIWRGDLPHGIHYIGVWVDTDLKNKDIGLPGVDFIDFLVVPTFYNQPNLPVPVTNIPEWLAKPLVARGERSAVLASPRIVNPVQPAEPSQMTEPPKTVDGQGRVVLNDSDRGSLSPMTNRWYRYDIKNKNGERLTVTLQWNYSDGNTFHQAGFGVYDRFQFDQYLRDDKTLGIGIGGSTGVDADFGPPQSKKIWRGVLPEGTYFIRVYNDTNANMDYVLSVSK